MDWGIAPVDPAHRAQARYGRCAHPSRSGGAIAQARPARAMRRRRR
ncbi:hypothetical protein BSIN_1344 [Burkholderia singularis]|uniref:Uncharacterized protein n=1 Tax=Burkholderia singularis TaxID=1503053 RepID=A0A238GYK1_9BURK|nr:hypothetical protein BSIN_1344 [Burkholderia singularis]